MYCFKNYNVCFWSAGNITYVDKILKSLLLKEEYDKCICIIGRTKDNNPKFWECNDLVNNTRFKIPKLDGQITKPLSSNY